MSTLEAALLSCGFRGRALAMQPADVAAGAARLKCELAMAEALLDVESSGHGFDASGRPKILPERHIFYRRLASMPASQAAAVANRLAYPNQGTLPYPATPDACYALLGQMLAIDGPAALESCSWGIAQVMGFNFAVGGYPDAATMVAACMDSEANQFGLMLGYLEKNGLAGAMGRGDVDAVTIGYNGRGAAPAYAARFRAALQHHRSADGAPPKLAAPALSRPPLFANQLASPTWLAVRGGNDGVADELNAAELTRVQSENA